VERRQVDAEEPLPLLGGELVVDVVVRRAPGRPEGRPVVRGEERDARQRAEGIAQRRAPPSKRDVGQDDEGIAAPSYSIVRAAPAASPAASGRLPQARTNARNPNVPVRRWSNPAAPKLLICVPSANATRAGAP
jgi:hypothetical protein